jgi:hypothetical protein
MNKHTPGPWRIEDELSRPCQKITSAGRNIAFSPLEPDRESSSNFRLIAAAPDLLEALKLVHHEMCQIGPTNETASRIIGMIMPAILKAQTDPSETPPKS